ncbi:hypothetical protein [Dysgonomonas sp. 521]|uniref:hypothetical protein n=1 Tax=Dysgonomonas sp. 521 TaxID=2302932 RepID=UPI0013D8C6D6|nr:hypothetical protein [Dysgonomonas sp. 521]
MTHQQILDKLHRRMAESMDSDLRRIIWSQMTYHNVADKKKVLELLMIRWNCALKGTKEEVTDNYKDMVILTLAVLLHRYGMVDEQITKDALAAIDSLNEKVVTSDAFFHQTAKMKEFLQNEPASLTKRPVRPKADVTFYRAQDVISFKQDGKYCAAYVHNNHQNEYPVIEFYDFVSDKKPDMQDLAGAKAKGITRANGNMEKCKYMVFGLKDLPDYANQVHLIQAAVASPPDNEHLKQGDGVWEHSAIGSDIIEIQKVIKGIIK